MTLSIRFWTKPIVIMISQMLNMNNPLVFFQDAFPKWYTWMDFWTRSAMWNIEAIIATFCFPSKLDLEKYFCEADDMVAEAS